jgi:hypothetical protein
MAGLDWAFTALSCRSLLCSRFGSLPQLFETLHRTKIKLLEHLNIQTIWRGQMLFTGDAQILARCLGQELFWPGMQTWLRLWLVVVV